MCMMCVALHGYHNEESKYSWRRNVANLWMVIDDQIHALLYTTQEGEYSCQVEVNGEEIVGTFKVKSKTLVYLNLCIHFHCNRNDKRGSRCLNL